MLFLLTSFRFLERFSLLDIALFNFILFQHCLLACKLLNITYK